MKTNFYLLISVLVLIISSCSIEKRLHRPGFYVDAGKTTVSKNQTPSHFSNTLSTAIISNKEVTSHELSNIFKENILNEIEHNNKELLAFNYAKQIKHNKDKDIVTYSLQKNITKKEIINVLKKYPKNLPLLKAQPAASSQKSQIVALLLCFFLGGLGIHSFYLGNKNKGFIQLGMFLNGFLTTFILIGYFILVALGIWVLIDFIRLLIGDLGPGW